MCIDEPYQRITPKLESLTLAHLDIVYGSERDLLDFLKQRRHHEGGLKMLVVRSCKVHRVEYKLELKQLVKVFRWEGRSLGK